MNALQLHLALLHEAGHAWTVLNIVGRPVSIIIPRPGSGEDCRCEWNVTDDVPPAAGVCVILAGLAAELAYGVPRELAYRNAAEDLTAIRELGLESRTEELIEHVIALLQDDGDFDRFYHSLLSDLEQRGGYEALPVRWTFSAD